MQVEQLADGSYVVDAPWLALPVVAESFEAAYDAALRSRRIDPTNDE